MLRLERELEGWKGLRMERGSGVGVNRSGTMAALSEMATGEGRASRVGSRKGSGMGGLDLPQRKPSNTKGFL